MTNTSYNKIRHRITINHQTSYTIFDDKKFVANLCRLLIAPKLDSEKYMQVKLNLLPSKYLVIEKEVI